jgi:hypothetical protein
MDFRFTKYSFINALWSLIPIFPTWTLFPGVFAAMSLEKITTVQLAIQLFLVFSSNGNWNDGFLWL